VPVKLKGGKEMVRKGGELVMVIAGQKYYTVS
jgi:hypothetical protein